MIYRLRGSRPRYSFSYPRHDKKKDMSDNSYSFSRRRKTTAVRFGGAVLLLAWAYRSTFLAFLAFHKTQLVLDLLLVDRQSSSKDDPPSQSQPKLTPTPAIQFPVHVTPNDTTTIRHPGLAAVLDAASKGTLPRSQVLFIERFLQHQNVSQTIQVPRFFDEIETHGGGKSVRQYLGGGHRLPTPDEARSIGSRDRHGRETIFVAITSYRDEQCRWTLEDLLERAKHPNRIRIAIVDQRLMQSENSIDRPCIAPAVPCSINASQPLCQYAHLIDYYSMDAKLAIGQTFARHILHRYYRGEYFVLLIDSHMRFVQDWDDDLIQQWKAARNEMAVLSVYPSADMPGSIDPKTHQSNINTRPIMCESGFVGEGPSTIMKHGQQPEGPPTVRGQPTLHPFWAGGFSFSRGHFVIQVPYDPYLPMVFHGDEISIGIRAFTYGYDLYAPERNVVFHQYQSKKSIPRFFENLQLYSGIASASHQRLNALVGLAHPDAHPYQPSEAELYGNGHIRNVQTFFSTFGIHPEAKHVEPNLCNFVGEPMMRVFGPALRPNGMGLDYSQIHFRFQDHSSKRNFLESER